MNTPSNLYATRFSLKNKVVLITGANGILGRNFCKGCAEAGADIVLVDINRSEMKEFALELEQQYSIKTLALECDITQKTNVQNMVSATVEKFGKIDVLLNNAGGKSSDIKACFAPFEDYSFDIWKEILAVNLDGVFLVAQAVGNQMVKQATGGSIIQTASIYGQNAPDQRIYEGSQYLGTQINSPAVYTASKAAVIGLTKYLACYWAEKNIRVNTISPGGVSSGQNDVFVKNYSRRVPLGRMGQAEEMVGAVIYLASDASSYVTGENILIDGGLSAW